MPYSIYSSAFARIGIQRFFLQIYLQENNGALSSVEAARNFEYL
jgi:hypothetical protein